MVDLVLSVSVGSGLGKTAWRKHDVSNCSGQVVDLEFVGLGVEWVGKYFEANFRVLMQYTQCCTKNPIDQRLAVVNAWNEWGEGMALEPSKEHGTALLEALQRVVDESRKDGFCMLQS